MKSQIVCLLLVLLVERATAFSPSNVPHAVIPNKASSTSTVLASTNDSNSSKKKPYDEGLRTKLLSESIAPWRTLRLFLYGSLGSGAFIGGLINLTGLLAAISKGTEGVEMNTEYLNLAIDFGAVAAFALLFRWDAAKQGELAEQVEEKLERKKAMKKVAKGMQERESLLASLKLDIQISADGSTKAAPISELQAGARQHMIVVIGPKKACKDALVGANLLKMDFAMSNVLVVPCETDVNAAELKSRPDGSGFGDTVPIYERQPYVARPSGDGWDDYIQQEIGDAVTQNGEKVKEEGIAIVVASNGKVIRRGVGKVPWRQMVEELDAAVKA